MLGRGRLVGMGMGMGMNVGDWKKRGINGWMDLEGIYIAQFFIFFNGRYST